MVGVQSMLAKRLEHDAVTSSNIQSNIYSPFISGSDSNNKHQLPWLLNVLFRVVSEFSGAAENSLWELLFLTQ